MQAISRGWNDIGRPVAGVALKVWAGHRLDLALAITVQTLVPGALGVGLSRGVRLLVATRIARSAQQHHKRKAGRSSGSGSDSEDEEEGEEDGGTAAGTSGRGASGSSSNNGRQQQGEGGPPRLGPTKSRANKPSKPPRPAPKGLGGLGLPAVPLPPLLPPDCSTQPIGLPMMLVGQSAARAPMYAMKGDRLVRGVLGLAATFLVCRAVRTPFTGRLARLPPRIVEYLFHSVVGPAAAVSYVTTSAAGQASSPGDRALCQQYKPTLQHLYTQLRAAGQAEAEHSGRGVVFAADGPSVEPIQRSDVNACCLPGGIVFVHSGLIKAVEGRQDSLAFVLGHEVGHAIGRHSLEKATQTYMGMFAVDTVVGLAQRFLQGVAPGEENEPWIAGRLKTLDGLLQSGLYLLQLGQSRRHEYEADQLAVALGSSAGMSRRSLLAGAGDTLTRFMKLEAAANPLSPLAAGQGAQGDSPLSTHPAAANRLRRLGAVKIGDLNDFIAPSQACVVSLEGGKLTATEDAEVGAVQLQQRAPKGFSQTLPAAPDQPVKVSLHDCLACSGCVTSAETVLLQHQSTGELLQRLADGTWSVVVSLSPQSVAALAALHGLPAADCAARLATFLRRLGARAVFDIAAARQLALAEAAAEFVQRYRTSARGAAALAAAGSAGAAGAAAGAGSDAMDIDSGPAAAVGSSIPGGSSGGGGGQPLPMLASACPGWVCYAEKTHGDHVLPYIATGKSPQAVMGTLVKRRWCGSAGLQPDRLYHCAVMPCYDKKLEASREDFWLPGTQVPETDSVLATSELQELLEQHGVDLRSLEPSAFDSIQPTASSSSSSGSMIGVASDAAAAAASSRGSHQANGSSSGSGSSGEAGTVPASSGSGGYLEYVFREAAVQLFGRQLPAGPLQMRVGRNADLREATLEVDGVPVLRFAAAYGFRNIQGLMRKVKLRRCEYDYVEVMACPSGCLNGGGQPKPAAGQTTAQLLEQLESLYASQDGTSSAAAIGHSGCNDSGAAAVQQLYAEWVGGPPGSEAACRLLHTQYHKREKMVAATLADW